MAKWLLVFIFINLPQLARADVEHTLFRKLVVFPIAEANFPTAEDAWWQMREYLTRDKKLLIASKRFMMNRGVFQPRKSLKPADAIILGRLLDAETLMVTFIDDRLLKIKVYDAENGYVLWESEVTFHPAVSINDQLIKLTGKLAADFIHAIPYQGFAEMDETTEKILSEKKGKTFSKIFIGGNVQLEVGDPVQWVSIRGDPSQALFLTAKIKILAEGVVREIQGDQADVEVMQLRNPKDIKENTLVRFPNEVAKLRDMYSETATGEESVSKWSGEYFKDEEMHPPADFEKETHPASTGIFFFLNAAIFVLLAF